MKNILVKENEEGKKLIKYLRGYFSDVSDGFLYKMFRKKNILLNDEKVKGTEVIRSGDKISIFFKDETIDKLTNKNSHKYEELMSIDASKLCVIYEDNDKMIIDKEEGILSQKAYNDDISINEFCLKHMIDNGELTKKDFETFKPSIVNRIDINTMGLMIFAKNYKSSVDLSEKIKNREIEKYYLALVNGEVKKDKENIKAYLRKDIKNNKANIISFDEYDKLKNGKNDYSKIETEYEVQKREKNVTYLKIKLLTGKTHQIRAHLSYIGHPIVGDKKYMDDDMYKMNVEKYNAKTQKLISYMLIIDGKKYKTRYKI